MKKRKYIEKKGKKNSEKFLHLFSEILLKLIFLSLHCNLKYHDAFSGHRENNNKTSDREKKNTFTKRLEAFLFNQRNCLNGYQSY